MNLYSIKPLEWINGKASTSWWDTFVIKPLPRGKKYKFLLEVQDFCSDGEYACYKFETAEQAIAKAEELYLQTLHYHLKLES